MSNYSALRVAQLREMCMQRGIDGASMRKRELIDALRLDDDIRNGIGVNDDVEDQAVCEQDDQNLRYDMSHANSRPAGEDVDYEREAEDESGDETGSDDDDGEVVFNPPIASTSAAGDEMDKQIRLEREKRETIKVKYALQRQAERERIEMQLQADRERANMQHNTGFSAMRADVASVQKLLPFMHDTSELLSFFNAFERVLEMHNVEKVSWGKFLPSQLNAKTLKAFNSLSAADTQNYDIVKQTILDYFKLDAEAYLRNFRSQRRRAKESYRHFLARLKESLLDFYQARGVRTMDDLTDSLLNEQFLMTLSPEVRQHVYAREPTCADDSAKFADVFFHSTRIGNESANSHITRGGLQHEPQNGKIWRPRGSSGYPYNGRPQPSVPNQGPAMQGHGRSQGPQHFARQGQPGPRFSSQQGARPSGGLKASQAGGQAYQNNQCYGCGKIGHKIKNCQQTKFQMPVCIFLRQETPERCALLYSGKCWRVQNKH